MATQLAATKGNLIATKKSFELAQKGFELLDRKRNILVREMMSLIDKATKIQERIDDTYSRAYAKLQTANITLGICGRLAKTVPEEKEISINYRSVMGVEIPVAYIPDREDGVLPSFGLFSSNSAIDEAYLCFDEVKRLTVELAEVENSVYRLADSIKKTQRRANALKNVMLPRFDDTIRKITATLEEKNREDFSRMKVIKNQKIEEN